MALIPEACRISAANLSVPFTYQESIIVPAHNKDKILTEQSDILSES
jgi:hypothetical protein